LEQDDGGQKKALKAIKLEISPMQLGDIKEVIQIEKESFVSPWSVDVFEEQLSHLDCASYFVARVNGKVIGYAGIIFPPACLSVDTADGHNAETEGHITNIAIDKSYRRKKIGSVLLLKLIEEAQNRGSRVISLELRKLNTVALSFYKKFGFRIFGLRKDYYSDTGEDAIVMFVDNVSSADYQNRLQIIRDVIQFSEE